MLPDWLDQILIVEHVIWNRCQAVRDVRVSTRNQQSLYSVSRHRVSARPDTRECFTLCIWSMTSAQAHLFCSSLFIARLISSLLFTGCCVSCILCCIWHALLARLSIKLCLQATFGHSLFETFSPTHDFWWMYKHVYSDSATVRINGRWVDENTDYCWCEMQAGNITVESSSNWNMGGCDVGHHQGSHEYLW